MKLIVKIKSNSFKRKNKFYLGPSFETIAATEKNAQLFTTILKIIK